MDGYNWKEETQVVLQGERKAGAHTLLKAMDSNTG